MSNLLIERFVKTTWQLISVSVFDRMFSLGVHMVPLSGRGMVASPGGAGPRRHFLFCTLKDEKEKKRGGAGAAAAGGVGTHRSALSLSRVL